MLHRTLTNQAFLALSLIDALGDQLLLFDDRKTRLFVRFYQTNRPLRCLNNPRDFIRIFVVWPTFPRIFTASGLLDQMVSLCNLLLLVQRDHTWGVIQALAPNLADALPPIVCLNLPLFKAFARPIRYLWQLGLVGALPCRLDVASVLLSLTLDDLPLFAAFSSL